MAEERKSHPLASTLAEEVWKIAVSRRCRPRATYRLEFHKEFFSFRDATRVVPYLADLGISHVYASPYLKVFSEAMHGYATVDYSQLNPDLGTQQDYEAYLATLHQHDMGQILDVVPNHMSAAPGENRWWTDMLEHGQCSPYACYFDVDWQPVEAALRDRLLLPILGDSFGAVLEKGELQLTSHEGCLQLKYYQRQFPLDPSSYPLILEPLLTECQSHSTPPDDILELQSILTALRNLPPRTTSDTDARQERIRETKVIQQRLATLIERSPSVMESLTTTLKQLNGRPEEPTSFDGLERILDQQVYRLSRWKAASDEINYRRFFDVNELAAICTERLDVFEASHDFTFELLISGAVDGLRIDHVDGLYEPRQYLWRLQWGYLAALARHAWLKLKLNSPQSEVEDVPWDELRQDVLHHLHQRLGGPSPEIVFADDQESSATKGAGYDHPLSAPLPLFVLVEKILGPDEPLPGDWPVAGTSGYDALNQLNGLFVDPEGFAKIRRNYHRFSEIKQNFQEIVLDSKRLILDVSMSSDLHLLAHRLKRLAESDRHSRDFTLNNLIAALSEIIICFPVYRTYSGPAGISKRDRTVIERAIRAARRRNPAMDASLFEFVRRVLLWEWTPSTPASSQLDLFVGRFQQVTSPVMAKGVEDTTFYRWVPLTSVNEVGAHPSSASVSVSQFHAENQSRFDHFPEAMICTSTHDTKRSEDVRSRLHLISEIPDAWRTAVGRWARLNRNWRTTTQGESAPTRNDEYLFYQTLVGIWPATPPAAEEHEQLVSRMQQYMEKAIHEAKLSTSWLSPNPEYEAAIRDFVDNALRPGPKNRFLEQVCLFNQQILAASRLTAASTVLLKLTSPGIPDIYQGQELWDESLVDPDNRRPVDYQTRQQLLAEIRQACAGDVAGRTAFAASLASDPLDPRFKLFVTWQALAMRHDHSELFQAGKYVPLEVTGPLADHFVAFARVSEVISQTALVIAPRLCGKLLAQVAGSPGRLHEIPGLEETILSCGPLVPGTFQNQFTGSTVVLPPSGLALSKLLTDFPLGLYSSATTSPDK